MSFTRVLQKSGGGMFGSDSFFMMRMGYADRGQPCTSTALPVGYHPGKVMVAKEVMPGYVSDDLDMNFNPVTGEISDTSRWRFLSGGTNPVTIVSSPLFTFNTSTRVLNFGNAPSSSSITGIYYIYFIEMLPD